MRPFSGLVHSMSSPISVPKLDPCAPQIRVYPALIARLRSATQSAGILSKALFA